MRTKSIGKYLLYAIGEIILVVIGILIAVSINNRNESSKQNRLLRGYLKTYKTDLEMDTLVAGRTLKTLELREKQFDIFLSDTVTKQTYIDNPAGYGLNLSYVPFEIQEKGYNLLANYSNEKEEDVDSLVVDIIANHRAFVSAIESTQVLIKDDISETITYFKNNKPWIAKLLKGDVTDATMQEYFASDQHKARIAIHQMLVIGNFQAFISAFKTKATQTIEKLEARLKIK